MNKAWCQTAVMGFEPTTCWVEFLNCRGTQQISSSSNGAKMTHAMALETLNKGSQRWFWQTLHS